MSLVLSTVRVGLINVNWTNGSRMKPLNPITPEIIADFEEHNNLKINWLSESTGTIKLKGIFNYLIYNNYEPYYLEISGVVDIDKSIFIYTLTKDVWMSFIMNANNSIKGCLIKTDNENVVWRNIQQSLGAVGGVNDEKILRVCKDSKCTGTPEIKDLITYFNRDEEGQINQFGFKYRFSSDGVSKFKELIRSKLSRTFGKKINQLIGFCPLFKKPSWENYVAGLVDNYLRYSKDLKIGKATDLSTLNMNGLKTDLVEKGWDTTFYCITKESDNTLGSFEVQNKSLNKLDLSQITEITYINGENMQPINVFNKDVMDMDNDEVTLPQKVHTFKNKLYHPVWNEHSHFNFLDIPRRTYGMKYRLNERLLTELNLRSLDISTYVKPYFYPDWTDIITDKATKKKVKDIGASTEIGFLMYKINNFSYKCFSENQFTYNGSDIYIATGLRISNFPMTCKFVKDKTTGRLIQDKEVNVLFGDVYKTDIEKSLWQTLWGVYMWQGQIGRAFEGVTQDGLVQGFKYTTPQCYVDGEEVYTYDKYITENSDVNKDKLPSYLTGIADITDNEYSKYITELDERRRSLEISQRISPPMDTGDLFWNDLMHGVFDGSKELEVPSPCLVIWSDIKYSYTKDNITTTSLNTSGDWGWKLGIIKEWEGLKITKVKNNLISSGNRLPKIFTLRPLLKITPEITYNRTDGYAAMKDFFRSKHGVFQDENIYIYSPYWNRYFINYFNWEGTYDWLTDTGGERALIVNGEDYDSGAWSYIRWKLTNGRHFYTYNQIASRDTVKKAVWDKIAAHNFRVGTNPLNVTYTSWKDLRTASSQLDQDLFKSVVSNAYTYLNDEVLHGNKYTHIDETFLKSQPNKIHLFGLGSQGKTSFYVLLKWAQGKSEPSINIIFADKNLLSDDPETELKITPSPLLINKNLVQVVNQQNILYVHGKTYPIKTKFVTDNGFVDYIWRCDKIEVEKDLQQTHYKMIFSGDGGDFIRDTITIINKEILNTIGQTNQVDLLNLNLQIEEQRKNRELAVRTLSEKERIEGINLRNTQQDIDWELSKQPLQNALGVLGAFTQGFSSIGQAYLGGTGLGRVGGLSGVANTTANIVQHFQEQNRNNQNRQRDQDESVLRSANAIELDKNRMDNSHKFEELREKRRLHEISNVHINSIPNNADILSSLHDMEDIKSGFCVFHRIPTGQLLNYLVEYHKNWGFDLVINDYETSINELTQTKGRIYQFSRVDETSLTNIKEQEIIKATFMNGVILVDYDYKLQHSSYLDQKRKHQEKIAAGLRAIEQEKAIKRQMQLEEIAASKKGIELAKTDYSEINKKLTEKEDELAKLLKELTTCKSQLVEKDRQMKTQEAEYNTYQDRLEAVQQREAKIDGELAAKTAECNHLLNNNQAEILALKQQIRNKEILIQTQKATITEYQNSDVLNQTIEAKNQLEREKETLENTNTRLEGEKTTLENEKASLQREKSELETKISELEARPVVEPVTEDTGELQSKITELTKVVTMLTKKKTRLDNLRQVYKHLYAVVHHYMESNATNYFAACASDHWNSGAYALGYLWELRIVNKSTKRNTCGPFYGTRAQDTTMPPLIPVGYKKRDVYYRSSYKGFEISRGTYTVQFYLYYKFTNTHYTDLVTHDDYETVSSVSVDLNNWDAIVNKFKKVGEDIVTLSNYIRKQNKDIATYIRRFKDIIPDAETRAVEWETLNY